MTNTILTIKDHLAGVPASLRVSLNACAQALRFRFPELDSATFFALLGVSNRAWKYWNDKGGARKWADRTEAEKENALRIVEHVSQFNIAAKEGGDVNANESGKA